MLAKEETLQVQSMRIKNAIDCVFVRANTLSLLKLDFISARSPYGFILSAKGPKGSRTFSTEIPNGTSCHSILVTLGFRQAQDDTVEKSP